MALRAGACWLLLAGFCLTAAGCPRPLPLPARLERRVDPTQFQECVARAAATSEWRTTAVDGTAVQLDRNRGPHGLSVLVRLADDVIAIEYRASSGFKYGKGFDGNLQIHKVAASWLRNLIGTIDRACASPRAPALFVLLNATYTPRQPPAPDATRPVTTAGYEALRTSARKAAVAAPSACLNTSSSGSARSVAAGVNEHSPGRTEAGSRAAGELLATACGVEMSVVEGVLASNDYAVVSWREFAAENVSILDAARRAGVDVLFQINSLEMSTEPAMFDQSNHWARSDEFGKIRGVLAMPGEHGSVLTAADIRALNAFVQAPPPASVPTDLALQADISAIDVKRGQTVWIYRRKMVISSEQAMPAGRQLLRRDDSTGNWREVRPARAPMASPGTATTSELPPQLDVGGAVGSVGFVENTDANRRAKGRDVQLEVAISQAVKCFKSGDCDR